MESICKSKELDPAPVTKKKQKPANIELLYYPVPITVN